MSDYIAGKALRKLLKGKKVDRATATLPQTTAAAIFNIVGGRVIMTQIVGEVTVVIQTQANNTKLTANPTTGTSVDICAVLSITADEVGTLYGITGLNTDAMIGINAGALPAQTRDVILPVGTLDLDCAASNSGSVKWTMFYIPLDDGAYVTAA
jgi:hypothetical protein